jgi:uncharacterized protein (DUF2384 family)
MAEQTLHDPEEVLASIMERQEEVLRAGRKASVDALQAYEQTLSAFADSQEKLAAASEVEWLSRHLRAQASLTREVGDAFAKFAREVMDV